MNSQERLVYMANQIARNVATQPEPQAIVAVADHIKAFWDPRMKAMILAAPEGLTPVARAAVERLRTVQ
ncbi:formate dehydrogenase subunit delta [Flavisphingomonas formosensis]|uniref:formate dehydrogenase subunit delta n=1 Tax=Flavisphingomonas formosensis TaxID=861534 RepID=UPI001E3F4A9A|nr:formate dehydrogenase subunit delta [Sphingomonas formosensis]